MNNAQDYLAAAKILASCPERRLPYVVELLKKGGIEVPEGVIEGISEDRGKAKKELKSEIRQAATKDKWVETDDEVVLKLRDLFESGVNVTHFADEAKISRTQFYRYLWGTRIAPAPVRSRLEETINRHAEK